MTTIDLNAQDELELSVRRTEDEYGWIELHLSVSETTNSSARIRINVGRFYQDAASLADLLETAAKEARQIVNEWKDLPDEHDAFVFSGREGYSVQLEGCTWDGSTLNLTNRASFPTRDIATYELAAAMTDAGCFPNAWYQDERGYTDEIHDDLRKYHDAGGDGLLPLPGVEYEPHADVTADGISAYVVRDYGALGIVYVYSGDDQHHYTDDRNTITRRAEDDDE